jgi:hypothetical protein
MQFAVSFIVPQTKDIDVSFPYRILLSAWRVNVVSSVIEQEIYSRERILIKSI